MLPRSGPLAALYRPLTALSRSRGASTTHLEERARRVYLVRDSTTRLYWCDPYLVRSSGDPRREWRPRRYSWAFPTRAAAASRIEDVGLESRLEIVESEPPPRVLLVLLDLVLEGCSTLLEFRVRARTRASRNTCTVQLLHSATIADCKYWPATEQMFGRPHPGISALSAVSTYNLDRDLHAQPRPKPQPAISTRHHTGTDKSCHFQ